MKKITALFFISLLTIRQCLACTTFFIQQNGEMVFGRNYDWVTGNGMVCTNQKGLSKTSDKTADGTTISWVSLYASITFNQYGKEFPTGGMNEKGLVVEQMWLDNTRYPTADSRPALDVLQWIQYQLDNCSSVDELIATDNELRIASRGSAPLHYLAADATGNAATIEFLDGKMMVHKSADLPFPVLTNDAYSSSLAQTKKAIESPGDNDLSFASNSIDRFAKACSMVKKIQQGAINTPAIDYSFQVLDKVAQGSHTKWSIVYDISNKMIHFKTLGYSNVKNISFSAFDFNCRNSSKIWDMNQAGSGNISSLFRDFSLEINRLLVNRSCEESASQITISKEGRQQTWQYAGTISCLKPVDLR
ncbi:MAG: linear amide C-N hydrolase [Bacteroidota bacterium]|nr:linear amide C-N hydrolase [Bacteroidota bacterium]